MLETVLKIRSETCWTEAQFCRDLHDKEGKLAGPTQILPVREKKKRTVIFNDILKEIDND